MRLVACGLKYAFQIGALEVISALTPGHIIDIDMVRPLRSSTSQENQYIIVITNYLSKFVQAIAVLWADAITAASCLEQ